MYILMEWCPVLDIILSPLMMAKWIEDNLSDEYDTADSANSESNVTTAQF